MSSRQPIIIHAEAEHERPRARHPSEDVPARIHVAIHLIEHFTAKTAIKALPIKKGFDDGVEWEPLPAVELTEEEQDAANAALQLLECYFKGNMRESSLEAEERSRQEEHEKQARLSGGPVLIIDCPQCNGGANQYRCLLCRTRGKVSIGMVP